MLVDCCVVIIAREDVWEARPEILHSDADTSGRRRRMREPDSGCERFFGTFFYIFFGQDFLALANVFSDVDTSGSEAESGYERCRDCTDITLHRHHCHRRSTCFKLSDFFARKQRLIQSFAQKFFGPF